MSGKHSKLVYSSDGSHLKICKKCEESPCKCLKNITIDPSETVLKIRIEKKGRGGKSVTVVMDLPNNLSYFKDLAKKLKSFCGTGGSFKGESIEIQGDQRDKVQKFLEDLGFKVIRSGG